MPDAFADRLARLASRIEIRLAALLGSDGQGLQGHGLDGYGLDGYGMQELGLQGLGPERLLAAMRHAALGGGKRLRPFLLVEAATLCGSVAGDPLMAGAAVELLHVYSLVHDDLPAMDDDDLRRGRPTAHRAFDEATAILAGDALQTLAFQCLSDPRTHPDPGVRAGLVLALARAAGPAGMVGGQMLDLAAEGRFGQASALDAGAVRRLQGAKTGALLAACVEMGGLMGRAAPEAMTALGRYGRALGAAFQVADDILDVESSSEVLGKATGKDAGRGKATLVGILGLEAARAERDRLAAEAVEALSGFGEPAATLREAARFAAERPR